MTDFLLTRRQTLIGSCLGAAGVTLSARPANHLVTRGRTATVRFGVITDVHQDIMHDAVD